MPRRPSAAGAFDKTRYLEIGHEISPSREISLSYRDAKTEKVNAFITDSNDLFVLLFDGKPVKQKVAYKKAMNGPETSFYWSYLSHEFSKVENHAKKFNDEYALLIKTLIKEGKLSPDTQGFGVGRVMKMVAYERGEHGPQRSSTYKIKFIPKVTIA